MLALVGQKARSLAALCLLMTATVCFAGDPPATEKYYEIWYSGKGVSLSRYSVAKDSDTAQKVVRALNIAGYSGEVRGPFDRSTGNSTGISTPNGSGTSTGGNTTTTKSGTTPKKATPPTINGPFSDGGITYMRPDGTVGSYSRGSGKYDRGTQPKFWDVPPVLPEGQTAPTRDARIVYINGINTDSQSHANTLQQIANVTGAAVVGVYNKTDGMGSDLAQCVQDKARDKQDQGNNAATTTMKEMIIDAIQNRRNLNVIAHSQGALITNNAVMHAKYDMYSEDMYAKLYPESYARVKAALAEANKHRWFKLDWDDIMDVALYNDNISDIEPAVAEMRANVENDLNRYVSIETYGGAGSSWPDGPKYRHVVNVQDLVPTKFGLGDPSKWKDMPTSEREARSGNWITNEFRQGWFPKTYGGRGAEMVAIDHGSMMNHAEFSVFGKDFSVPTTPSFEPHDIDGVYLTPGIVPGYEPVNYDLIRGNASGQPRP